VAATAFSILVHTETTMPSGFFLKKKPPCTIFKWQHVNRKRSSEQPETNEIQLKSTRLQPLHEPGEINSALYAARNPIILKGHDFRVYPQIGSAGK
jgi:hypothetical protein